MRNGLNWLFLNLVDWNQESERMEILKNKQFKQLKELFILWFLAFLCVSSTLFSLPVTYHPIDRAFVTVFYHAPF